MTIQFDSIKDLMKKKKLCKESLKERCNQIANTIDITDLKKSQKDVLDLIYKIIEIL